MPDVLACTACPRLAAFLAEARAREPADWHNRPVAPYGDPAPRVLVVGLAPGYRGANRTGIPFLGDRSGAWLYRALAAAGFATSEAPGAPLVGARITNAVKCVPPANRPTGAEIRTCRERWLAGEIAVTPARVWLALGGIAHDTLLAAAGVPRRAHPFAHGAEHALGGGVMLLDAYHPSPLNTQTGRITRGAFEAVFLRAAALVPEA